MHSRQLARAASSHRRLTPAELGAITRQADGPAAEQTVDALAETMRRQFPNCTEASLQAEGFTLAFQKQHGDAAREIANGRFVRTEHRIPEKTFEQFEAEATAVIFELLPPDQLVVAELQARGITKPKIDVIFAKAKARAALLYAGGTLERVDRLAAAGAGK